MKCRVRKSRSAAELSLLYMDAILFGWLFESGVSVENIARYYKAYVEVSDEYSARYGTDQGAHYAAMKRYAIGIGVEFMEQDVSQVRSDLQNEAKYFLDAIDSMCYLSVHKALGWGKNRLNKLNEPLKRCHRFYIGRPTYEDRNILAKYIEELKEAGIDVFKIGDKADIESEAHRLEQRKEERFKKAKEKMLFHINDKRDECFSLIDRYDKGERSDELYKEMMEIGRM